MVLKNSKKIPENQKIEFLDRYRRTAQKMFDADQVSPTVRKVFIKQIRKVFHYSIYTVDQDIFSSFLKTWRRMNRKGDAYDEL